MLIPAVSIILSLWPTSFLTQNRYFGMVITLTNNFSKMDFDEMKSKPRGEIRKRNFVSLKMLDVFLNLEEGDPLIFTLPLVLYFFFSIR